MHLHKHSVSVSQKQKMGWERMTSCLRLLVPLMYLHKCIRHLTISVGLITIWEAIIPKTGLFLSGLVLVASHIFALLCERLQQVSLCDSSHGITEDPAQLHTAKQCNQWKMERARHTEVTPEGAGRLHRTVSNDKEDQLQYY